VNKADGDTLPAAMRSVREYKSALRMVRPRYPWWRTGAYLSSSKDETLLVQAMGNIDAYFQNLAVDDGKRWWKLRQMQQQLWLQQAIGWECERMMSVFRENERKRYDELMDQLNGGLITPFNGAGEWMAHFKRNAPQQWTRASVQ